MSDESADISIDCPGCNRRFSVPAKHAGKTGKCKACGAMVTIPAPSPPADDLYDFAPQAHLPEPSRRPAPLQKPPAAASPVLAYSSPAPKRAGQSPAQFDPSDPFEGNKSRNLYFRHWYIFTFAVRPIPDVQLPNICEIPNTPITMKPLLELSPKPLPRLSNHCQPMWRPRGSNGVRRFKRWMRGGWRCCGRRLKRGWTWGSNCRDRTDRHFAYASHRSVNRPQYPVIGNVGSCYPSMPRRGLISSPVIGPRWACPTTGGSECLYGQKSFLLSPLSYCGSLIGRLSFMNSWQFRIRHRTYLKARRYGRFSFLGNFSTPGRRLW